MHSMLFHYAQHALSIKNFGPPTLRFGPYTWNALAPALMADRRDHLNFEEK